MARLLAAIRLTTRAGAWLSGALIVVSALLIGGDVIARNLFNAVPFRSFELSRYLFGAAVAFALSFALTERAHIRIDPLVKLLPGRLRAVFDVAALVSVVPVAGTMAWQAWSTVAESARLAARSTSGLSLPLAVPQGIWAAGLTLFALVSFSLALLAAHALARGRMGHVDALAGLPAPEAEIPSDTPLPDSTMSLGAGGARS